MPSFGYQVLWNHLLALIELQGLDPIMCLHQGTERHAVSFDLVEEFRAPIVDSLRWLIAIDAQKGFSSRWRLLSQ